MAEHSASSQRVSNEELIEPTLCMSGESGADLERFHHGIAGGLAVERALQVAAPEQAGSESPEGELEYRRVLTEKGTALLAEFTPKAQTVLKEFLLDPEALKPAVEWYKTIEAPSFYAQRAMFAAATRNIRPHLVLGEYFREITRDEEKLFGMAEVPGATQFKHVPKEIKKPVVIAPDPPRKIGKIATEAARPDIWIGRPKPLDQFRPRSASEHGSSEIPARMDLPMSAEFLTAMTEGSTRVRALNHAGLQIVEHDNERHVFVGDQHVPLPQTTARILLLVGQWELGITKDRLIEVMQRFVRQRVVEEGINNHLNLLGAQLGPDHFRQEVQGHNPANTRKVIRVVEAISRQSPFGIQMHADAQ